MTDSAVGVDGKFIGWIVRRLRFYRFDNLFAKVNAAWIFVVFLQPVLLMAALCEVGEMGNRGGDDDDDDDSWHVRNRFRGELASRQDSRWRQLFRVTQKA